MIPEGFPCTESQCIQSTQSVGFQFHSTKSISSPLSGVWWSLKLEKVRVMSSYELLWELTKHVNATLAGKQSYWQHLLNHIHNQITAIEWNGPLVAVQSKYILKTIKLLKAINRHFNEIFQCVNYEWFICWYGLTQHSNQWWSYCMT